MLGVDTYALGAAAKLTVKVIAVGKMTKTAGEWGSKPRSARAVATEIKKDLAKRK